MCSPLTPYNLASLFSYFIDIAHVDLKNYFLSTKSSVACPLFSPFSPVPYLCIQAVTNSHAFSLFKISDAYFFLPASTTSILQLAKYTPSSPTWSLLFLFLTIKMLPCFKTFQECPKTEDQSYVLLILESLYTLITTTISISCMRNTQRVDNPPADYYESCGSQHPPSLLPSCPEYSFIPVCSQV